MKIKQGNIVIEIKCSDCGEDPLKDLSVGIYNTIVYAKFCYICGAKIETKVTVAK
jgi:hypothetical protein